MRSGRFEKGLDEAMRGLNASIDVDRRLYREDIEGSLAWSEGLPERGLITPADAADNRTGLQAILAEIEAGRFAFSAELEDIHMNVEARLTASTGAAGEKLHTGRSRNDQVTTDLRLHLKRAARDLAAQLREVIASI